jgi:hypothetical protein
LVLVVLVALIPVQPVEQAVQIPCSPLLHLLVVVVAAGTFLQIEMVLPVALVAVDSQAEQAALAIPHLLLHLKEVTVEMVAELGLTLAVAVVVVLVR